MELRFTRPKTIEAALAGMRTAIADLRAIAVDGDADAKAAEEEMATLKAEREQALADMEKATAIADRLEALISPEVASGVSQ